MSQGTQDNRAKQTRRGAQQRNHPAKGAAIKVEPIRSLIAIDRIKQALAAHPRDLCLFILGINTAYRAGELLSLRIGDVATLRAGDSLEVKQPKSGKYRRASLNSVAVYAIGQCLHVHPAKHRAEAPLFFSQKQPRRALGVAALNRMVKSWCLAAGLCGNYGSHSLRKTWGYQQRIQYNAPLPLLMRAFGHSSETQTLAYLCIQPLEIQDLYLKMEL